MTDEQDSNAESLVVSGRRGVAVPSQGLVARGLRDLIAWAPRTVRFPPDRSMGTLLVLDRGAPWYGAWESLGGARGTVTVPEGKTVGLTVSPEGSTDLSPLAALAPNGLRALDLAGTAVGDGELVHVQGLTGLEMLDLGHTRITDAGLEHLARMTALEALWLNDTQITDAGMGHLLALTSLRWLILENTKVTDSGREVLERALPILPQPAHPAMLLVADPGGTPKPGLEEEWILDLEPESLIPEWWPWSEQYGRDWIAEERKEAFIEALDIYLPSKKNLMPDDVLSALHSLREVAECMEFLSSADLAVYFERLELSFLRMLAPALQSRPEPEVVRVLLRQAQEAGLDPASLYRLAVAGRRKHWPAAPPPEEVLPKTGL